MPTTAQVSTPFAGLLAEGLHDLQMTKWMCAAALTVIVYDYILTFESERRYVWGRRFSLLQVLFFLNRYPPIAFQLVNLIFFHLPTAVLTDQLCQSFQLGAIPAQVEIQWTVAAAIVAHRLWALYADCALVKTIVFITWLCAVIALLVINIIILPQHGAAADGLPFGMRLCHPTTSLRDAWIPPLPAIIFDLFAFILALSKLLAHRRLACKIRTATGNGIRIYDNMAMGSALYFVVMLAGHVTTMVTATKRESLNFIWIPMMFSLSSIACSHMVIDVRMSCTSTPSRTGPASPDDLGSAGFTFARRIWADLETGQVRTLGDGLSGASKPPLGIDGDNFVHRHVRTDNLAYRHEVVQRDFSWVEEALRSAGGVRDPVVADPMTEWRAERVCRQSDEQREGLY